MAAIFRIISSFTHSIIGMSSSSSSGRGSLIEAVKGTGVELEDVLLFVLLPLLLLLSQLLLLLSQLLLLLVLFPLLPPRFPAVD